MHIFAQSGHSYGSKKEIVSLNDSLETRKLYLENMAHKVNRKTLADLRYMPDHVNNIQLIKKRPKTQNK